MIFFIIIAAIITFTYLISNSFILNDEKWDFKNLSIKLVKKR